MKRKELRDEIDRRLSGIIDRDYVFLDLPYHANIGDSLIYAGVIDYLSALRYKCRYMSSLWTFDDRIIPEDVMILFNGGGNFGDLWMECTEFRNRIIRKYPNHKYLIFPQSVWYENQENLEADIELFSRCRQMTICARDNASYQFLKTHFTSNNILLVPDMAFHLPENLLLTRNRKSGRVLFLRRTDKELASDQRYDSVPSGAEVHDWPTLERIQFPFRLCKVMEKVSRRTLGRISNDTCLHLIDFYWRRILLPYNVRTGICFVNQYDVVYTTRLHTAVLATLLGKELHYFDNSYKKISALYETWI